MYDIENKLFVVFIRITEKAWFIFNYPTLIFWRKGNIFSWYSHRKDLKSLFDIHSRYMYIGFEITIILHVDLCVQKCRCYRYMYSLYIQGV